MVIYYVTLLKTLLKCKILHFYLKNSLLAFIVNVLDLYNAVKVRLRLKFYKTTG